MKWKKLLSGILSGALLFTSFVPVSAAAEPAATGSAAEALVAEYNFEGDLSNSVGTDDAASMIVTGLGAYDGQASYVQGTRGKAVKLGSFGLQLNKKNLGKNFTVSAWYKADGTFLENQNLMFLGYHNPEKWIGISGNKTNTNEVKIWTRDPAVSAFNNWITLNKQTVEANEWHCLTLTQSEDGNVKTYVDGELKGTQKGAFALDGENQDIYIGVNNWDNEFSGAVDDVKVYNKTLSDDEVRSLCYDLKVSDEALSVYDFADFNAAEEGSKLTDGTREISLVTNGNGTAPSLVEDDVRGQVLETQEQGTADNGLIDIGYAQLPSNPFDGQNADKGITLNFWANTQGNAAGGRCMIDFKLADAPTAETASNPNDMRCGTFAFNQQMVYWNTTSQDGKFTDFNVGNLGLSNKNTWTMVTMTVTKEGISFYSNGRQISHKVQSGTEDYETMINELTGNSAFTPEAGTEIRLGASMAKYWTGAGVRLDDIAFFGRALSAKDIAALYDETIAAEKSVEAITITGAKEVDIEKSIQLSASTTPADASGFSDLTWTSNNSSIATVDENGVVKGLGEGTVEITASIGDVTSEPFTVDVIKPDDITSLEEGYYLAVYTTKTPFYANAGNIDQETQSVYFAVSKDGKTFDVLNNGGGVIFSKNGSGSLKISDPKIFKADGTFKVIARDANASKGYHEFTSTDGVHYYDDVIVADPSQTSPVLDPASFTLMLNGSDLLKTDANLTLGNAVELTEDEYTYIVNKLGTVVNNGLTALDAKDITTETTLTEEMLAESYPTATATYTDGSTQTFPIDWTDALKDVDLSKEGTYTIEGKVVQTKYLNNLKELNGSKLPEDDPENENPAFPDNYDPATGTVYYDETKFVEGMADPCIYWDEQTQYYYMTGSYFPEAGDAMEGETPQQYDRVVLRRGKTLEELQDRSKQVTIWKVGNQGYENAAGDSVASGRRYIWAPEIHRVGDNWVVYFTESHGDLFNIYCHALILDGSKDPYETALTASDGVSEWKDYQMRGGSGLTNAITSSFCLDMTYFKDDVNGESYVIWASKAYGNSALYMSKVDEAEPWKLTSEIVELTTPEYGWENVRYMVNEGATTLQKDGIIYLCYSAAGTGSEYAIGMLTAKAGTDLLDPDAWTKSPYPLLTSRDVDGEEGPGHNSFTVDKDGNAIFVYHARPTSHNYRKCGWNGQNSSFNNEPLNDPCRHARLKRVHWAADGTPILKMTYANELTEENQTISLTINVKASEPEEPTKLPFTDVTDTDWFFKEVAYNLEKGYMFGKTDTVFAPYENLARAQFAVILHRIEGEPEGKNDKTFPDVASEEWYTDAVLWAASSDVEIIKGYTDTGLFGTADNITREQMAVMMYRYAIYKDYEITGLADFGKFSDADKVSEFANEAMQWAFGNGIITGKDNGTRLDPQGNTSRAECAIIIQRFAEKYIK